MTMYRVGILVLCATLFIATPIFAASAPSQLSVQGVVNDVGTDKPIEGTLKVRFTLYDENGGETHYVQNGGGYTDPTGIGASVIWTEIRQVEFKDGVYAELLGSEIDNPLPKTPLAVAMSRLEFKIADDSELSPRMSLGSVPYAFKAGDAEGVLNGVTPESISVTNEAGEVTPVIDSDGNWIGELLEEDTEN